MVAVPVTAIVEGLGGKTGSAPRLLAVSTGPQDEQEATAWRIYSLPASRPNSGAGRTCGRTALQLYGAVRN